MMKRITLAFCSMMLFLLLTACGIGEVQSPVNAPTSLPPPEATHESKKTTENPLVKPKDEPDSKSSLESPIENIAPENPTQTPSSELLLQLTTQQGEIIIFALNNSNAALSLYEQLPLSLSIEDYGEHEKIFYPPEKLDTSDTPLAKGPVGTLAYYAPWGNVAIYSGDCGGASGLYGLGQVISGSEYISQLSGVVQLEAVSGTVSSAVSTPPVQTPPTNTPAAPPAQEEAPPNSVPPVSTPSPTPPESTPESSVPEDNIMSSIQIMVGNTSFTATLEENEAGTAFAKLLKNAPLSISMSDYSGFEKVGSLGTSLPESNRQITAQAGDIILYNSNQICVFYGSNSWSYTRLGKVDDLSGFEEALGSGDVTLTFSLN